MLTWKLKGTTFNRFYFQLRVSALPTSDTASGLLPTPTTDSAYDRNAPYAQGGMPLAYAVKLLPTPAAQDGKNHTLSPSQRERDSVPGWVMRQMLPTPLASDGRNSPLSPSRLKRNEAGLPTAIAKMMLPTPQASDGKRGAAEAYVNEAGKVVRRNVTANGRPFGAQLTDVVRLLGTPLATGKARSAKFLGKDKAPNPQEIAKSLGGSLNPRFVGQMMGFPPDWCELPATVKRRESLLAELRSLIPTTHEQP